MNRQEQTKAAADKYQNHWHDAQGDDLPEIDREVIGTLDGGVMISFGEVTNVAFQEKEIIDAVFEMLVWLKESGKI